MYKRSENLFEFSKFMSWSHQASHYPHANPNRVMEESRPSPVEDRGFTGFLQSHGVPTTPPNSPQIVPMLRDNLRRERRMGMSTGRCSSLCRRNVHSQPSKGSSETGSTQSSPDPTPLMNMSGRTQPVFPGLDSSLEQNPFVGTQRPIGMLYGNRPEQDDCSILRHRYEFNITAPSNRSLLTFVSQLASNERSACFGVKLVPVSRDERGRMVEWKLTLKIPGPNFGVATVAKEMVVCVNVVIIDEFRGDIDISHLLRWFDRYPVIVEVKGSSAPLIAENIWITSNLHPSNWYPLLDSVTYAALERRLEITEFQ